MEQTDKELLLKDLCARLPYNTIVDVKYSNEHGSSLREHICSEGYLTLNTDLLGLFIQEEILIKPYLRSMLSMTEEEREELFSIIQKKSCDIIEQIKNDDFGIMEGKYHFNSLEELDWLNAHHFDYHDLIAKKLALDCTGLHIYDYILPNEEIYDLEN